MPFLKKLIKNRALVLCVSVIVVSLVYIGVQKAIDNYNFDNDIIAEEELDEASGENALERIDGDKMVESETESELDEESIEDDGEISSEETDLVLEDSSSEEVDSGISAESGVADEGITKNKIYVYITGEVNVPGVVILNEGSRIVDAINAAGGTTDKANISKVNLVYVLDDGMKVNIPNNNDLKNNSDFEYITMNSGDGGNDDYSGGSASISNSSGASGGASSGSETSGTSKKYDIVNINTATQTELETLPGIGPSLALKIINYRKENGKFSSIEQIKDVNGIGDSKFESLKRYITI